MSTTFRMLVHYYGLSRKTSTAGVNKHALKGAAILEECDLKYSPILNHAI